MGEEAKLLELEDALIYLQQSYHDIDQNTNVAIIRWIDEEVHKISTLQVHLEELKSRITSELTLQKARRLQEELVLFSQELKERRASLINEKKLH